MSACPRIIVRSLPLPAVAVLGVAGCSTPTVPTAPATPTAAAGTSAPGASPSATTADFTIRGYKFPPFTAAAGQKITIADGDGEPHTVTADNGSFDTKSFDTTAPGTLTAPTTAGVYPVHCTVHPSMHGTLTVH